MKIDLELHKLLTLPTGTMVAISLSSGLMLFLPEYWLYNIRLLDIVDEHGLWFFIVFIIFTSIIIVRLLALIYPAIIIFNDNKTLTKELRKLDRWEKEIINQLFLSNDYTTGLRISSGSVRKLETRKIITRTSNIGKPGSFSDPIFPFTLNSWVIDEINKDKALYDSIVQNSH